MYVYTAEKRRPRRPAEKEDISQHAREIAEREGRLYRATWRTAALSLSLSLSLSFIDVYERARCEMMCRVASLGCAGGRPWE